MCNTFPDFDARMAAFAGLGDFLRSFCDGKIGRTNAFTDGLEQVIEDACACNGWFTRDNILYALAETGKNLSPATLASWTLPYKDRIMLVKQPKTIATVMAGNIPLAGFHDLLCVLMSGNKMLAKLSEGDSLLIPFLYNFLCSLDEGFKGMVSFAKGPVKDYDAVIATGSNNSSRYFEYYFRDHPHIIRRNRNGLAVLSGSESMEELKALCNDIFLYFGLGCRSVSRLFVPAGYSFEDLTEASQAWRHIRDHHKYASNYLYYRVLFQMSGEPHIDNGLFLLKKDKSFSSPVSVLFYDEYNDISRLNERLKTDGDNIQCIVSSQHAVSNALPFGTSQQPLLSDYADGVDTMEFLLELKE